MNRKEEIEVRKAELKTEISEAKSVEEVQELEKEVDALNEEVELIEETEKEKDLEEQVQEGEVVPEEVSIEEKSLGGSKMKEEVRNSKQYINAFASYIKEDLVKDYTMTKEERALLTSNAEDGVVAVPDMVDDIVKTAWEREEIMSLVRSISVKGNFSVQFEVSADGAVVHTEGGDPVDEEDLVLGIATLVPKSIKKWISVSDEVLDMKGEDFLNYIYDELTYRIAKKCADILVDKIAKLPQTLVANEDGIYDTPSAVKIEAAPQVGTVAKAYANLSDEASDITIIMNKLTHANFKEAAYANGIVVDPFEGFRVRYNNTLPAYDTAKAGEVYMIVGDLNHGSLANFPNGEGISLKYDDKTLMTQDLVRILGRRFAGIGVVADKAFTLVAKATETSE